jgi:CRP-like cAMP-binding protein
MALLEPGRRRGADVTALSYCQLLVLHEEDLRTLFATQPGLREKISKVAQERQEMNRGGLTA